MDIVRIKWMDIVTYHEKRYLSVAQSGQPAQIDIVGFLLSEDDTVLRLSPMLFTIPECEEIMPDDYSVIPKACIIERETLMEAE